jgi:hypothetical protein
MLIYCQKINQKSVLKVFLKKAKRFFVKKSENKNKILYLWADFTKT